MHSSMAARGEVHVASWSRSCALFLSTVHDGWLDNAETTVRREIASLLIGEKMKDDWVPINWPENLEEMMENWAKSREENVGWCLLCNNAIHTAEDLLPGTNTHNCEAGRALEEEIARGESQAQKPHKRCSRRSRG